MKDEMILYNDKDIVVSNKKDATKFELITYTESGNINSIKFGSITNNKKTGNEQKQNMALEGFTTTTDLDRQLESILRSIEPEVMKSLKSSNYFNKQE